MFDIGMWELMVVGIVALIVVGPKDLPKMFRTLGQVTGRIRAMAREFQTTMNAAASESGFDDLAKDLKKATDVTRDLRNITSPRKMGLDALKDAALKVDPVDENGKERPLTETEKLAKKRHEEAEQRVTAARDRAAARAAGAEDPGADAGAEAPAAATAAPEEPQADAPRTGTADT
jgi:sec-independent protein translocase protein TatB